MQVAHSVRLLLDDLVNHCMEPWRVYMSSIQHAYIRITRTTVLNEFPLRRENAPV
jgi:hypothetical protein